MAWNVTIFWNGLVLAKTFAPRRHTSLCAIPCSAFQCCCSELVCSSQNFIEKFNAVWFGGCCLGSCQTVAKWFTGVQTLFLPAMWTTSVCECQLISLRSECVNSVGSCGTEAGCRDQVQLEGWSVHLLICISQNQCRPPAACADCKTFSLPWKESDVSDAVLL